MAKEAQTSEINTLTDDDLEAIQNAEPSDASKALDETLDDEEEVPTFGDTLEEAQDTENATIRHLRDKLKEAHKEIAEVKRSIPQTKPVELGPEPDLWDEGIDGDSAKLREAVREYDKKKANIEQSKNAAQEAAANTQKAWEARLSKVAEEKVALAKPDVDEAFDTVKAALGDDRFAGIIGIVDDGNAAKFIYALSRNPDQLSALSSQTDPIKLVKEVTRLEGQLKMVKRRTPPNPDTPERGSAPISKQTGDQTLEKLEREAERTKDRSKVIAYKRQLRQAG